MQADLRLCLSHIPHCWKSHVAAQYHVLCDRFNLLFIVNTIMEVRICSMFCCTLLYVRSSFAIILMGKRKLVALLSLSSWCPVFV